MDRETRRRRGLAWLVPAILAGLLAACGEVPEAHLTLSPNSIVISGAADGTLFVGNSGEPGSILRIATASDADWLDIAPSEGRIGGGDTLALTVSIRAEVTPPEGSSTTLDIRTNAGAQSVQISVRRDLGPSICAHGLDTIGALGASTAAVPAFGAFREVGGPPAIAAASVGREPREVLVRYHDDGSTLARAARAGDVSARAGAQLLRAGAPGQHDLLRLPDTGADAALRALEADPRVMLVAPNVEVHRLGVTPDDPAYPEQWWAWCFGLPEAWSVNPGTVAPGVDSVVLAVVDDGVNVSHRDLVPKLLPGYDFAERNDDVRSLSPHGTHVAGIAVALGENGVAIAGAAYGADVLLLPVKVFPDDPSANGTVDTLVNGMRWAVGLPVAGVAPNPHPADVVNLSLGVGASPPAGTVALFEATLADMRARGAVIVAAAGNRGSGFGVEYPARAAGAIAVGAVDWTGLRSSFSTYGPGLDLMAPGGSAHPASAGTCRHLLSLGISSDTALFCQPGTSMATPFVSGAAALLIADDPARYRADPAAVEARLAATALSDGGMNESEYGAGIACPDAALGATSRCGWPAAD